MILKLVKLALTCATLYSSIYQPTACTALQVPGILTGSPYSSVLIFPVKGFPSRTTLPVSRTSKAILLAIRVDVVFKLMLYAIRKSRAPITVAPLLAL